MEERVRGRPVGDQSQPQNARRSLRLRSSQLPLEELAELKVGSRHVDTVGWARTGY